jgi:hypothetical protein
LRDPDSVVTTANARGCASATYCRSPRHLVGRRAGCDADCSASSVRGMDLTDRDLALVLAGRFELRITCLESDVACAQIDDLAEKLLGDRTAMFYGAPSPDRR